ncbi:Rubrerythrin [Planctomycetes bacterium Pan216]|uniref:Rubrerythrin n=1 Tax=Kolteria novifilia TaxID=2527975 RepID=A0A518B7L7_9BACT|nr:Rubrerythrin [Planctomycetes bacterium Pan216]
MRRRFGDLSAEEILALAISLEEEDARLLQEYARVLRPNFPKAAADIDEIRSDENGHRHRLVGLFQAKYGEEIPLLRRQDVKGFLQRGSLPLAGAMDVAKVRNQMELMEAESQRFYQQAAARATDPEIRQLLGDLADEERKHENRAAEMTPDQQPVDEREDEARASRQLFVLQVVQPGLAGLMDGSVSSLAPVFAAAFATRDSWQTFLVGMAAAVGAGISMGFAEAISDDGSLSGRGRPLIRGLVCGGMTFLGGVGHTLPYLIPDFWIATIVATVVVAVELLAIAGIRNRYMDTPFLSAMFEVVVGGVLVFLAGILIGNS